MKGHRFSINFFRKIICQPSNKTWIVLLVIFNILLIITYNGWIRFKSQNTADQSNLIITSIYIYYFLVFALLEIDYITRQIDQYLPSDPYDIFWTIWNTDPSTFRARRLLVIESIFIHHPNATIIHYSSTLSDKKLFAPFRQRGYRIYMFNLSREMMIDAQLYTNNRTRDFLLNWNTSSVYFHYHISDYLRTILLYRYGGTYLDMDALILQPLPRIEFIGLDRIEIGAECTWCVKNRTGLYTAPGFMRFQPRRKILKDILENGFDRDRYNPNCFGCAGPRSYTRFVNQYLDKNEDVTMNLQLLEPHRLYPFMWLTAYNIFYTVYPNTSLQLADLMKRSYSLHLFGYKTDKYSITEGSLMDLLFQRFDLGGLRPLMPTQRLSFSLCSLIYPSVYIYNPPKQGRFIGRDVIYLRLNHASSQENIRWTVKIHVSNGTITLPANKLMSNLNQAEVNSLLNEISYEPFISTSVDTLIVQVESEHIKVNCSVLILIFSQWVTVLTKTMGTVDRWPVIQRLVASITNYFPYTRIHIGSDSGENIDKEKFLDFISSEGIRGNDIRNTIYIHDLPKDAGLSYCRNYMLNVTWTPFFFLIDDDFIFEEDSHLDLLLEIIYTSSHIDIVAGKIPEDIKNFQDFSGIFLRYNQTLELAYNAPVGKEDRILFDRPVKKEVCTRVDFVPNVFMGRTESVQSIGWSDYFKVGEHEDFFLRFGEANRSVYTCEYINVHHHQIAWWKKTNSTYYAKRGRIFEYFKDMLKKYKLKRLITFGHTNVDLNAN